MTKLITVQKMEREVFGQMNCTKFNVSTVSISISACVLTMMLPLEFMKRQKSEFKSVVWKHSSPLWLLAVPKMYLCPF